MNRDENITQIVKELRDRDPETRLQAVDRLSRLKDPRKQDHLINMPLMDGFKLMGTLRQDPNNSQIPVIVVTTEGSESDRKKGMGLGANAYLSKPIRTTELLRKVKKILKV